MTARREHVEVETTMGTDTDVSPLARFARMVVPWVGLIVIVTLTWSFVGQYRNATRSSGSETTGTTETTATDAPAGEGGTDTAAENDGGTGETAAPSGTYVLVLADGLNLRSRPMTSATVVKQLPKDTQLVLLEKGSGWYLVRDPEGAEGWVAAGGSYTKLVEP